MHPLKDIILQYTINCDARLIESISNTENETQNLSCVNFLQRNS
jgi:hypothetical protein